MTPQGLIALLKSDGDSDAQCLREFIDSLPVAVYTTDAEGRLTYYNPAAVKLSGGEPELGTDQWCVSWKLSLSGGTPLPIAQCPMAVALRGGHPQEGLEYLAERPDGTRFWFTPYPAVLRDSHGRIKGAINLLAEVTPRKEAEAKAESTALLHGAIVEHSDDAIVSKDLNGLITTWNKGAERLYGYTAQEAIGQPITILIPPDRLNDEPHILTRIKRGELVEHYETVRKRKDGTLLDISLTISPVKDKGGNIIGASKIARDITHRKRVEEYTSHLAYHDALTGLPTRTLLYDRLEVAIARAVRHRSKLALLMVDLDRFKNVNDTMGHDAGDKVLTSVAKCLQSAVRRSDTVARVGGDEFVVLIDDLHSVEAAERISEKLVLRLQAGIATATNAVSTAVSIGISVYPDNSADADELIKHADMAMYYAKANGGNRFQSFDSEMELAAAKRKALEAGLRTAIDRDEFLLYYQPVVSLDSGELTGVEALLRWQPQGPALRLPGEFIPFAEDSGLILQIGRWAMIEACRQVRTWQQAGLLTVPVAVNVSTLEFRSPGFVDRVRQILKETGLEARFLELELTEGALMDDVKLTTPILEQLKKLDVRITVDDFGIGYSSLHYLGQFPVDTLKIDQSFVRRIGEPREGSKIAAAIVKLGRSLDYRVVAEGIETEGQQAYLLAAGCPEGQGYLFARPMAAADFAALLQSRHAARE